MRMHTNLLILLVMFGLAITLPLACDGGDPSGEQECTDGLDNDEDGLTDCYDPDCADKAECQGCGNLIKDGTEECDGDDFGNEFCESMGFVGGWLACNPDCTIDTSACVPPVCGDGIAQGAEDCDGYDMGDHASCAELGFLGGFVLCNTETCEYDTSQCFMEVTCSDVTITSPETPWCTGQPSGGGYFWWYREWMNFGGADEFQLWLLIWGPQNMAPGTYDLEAADSLDTCSVCALLVECADPNCQYAGKTYLPTAGTAQLTEIALANTGSLRGTLMNDINWKEVEVNWDTLESTPIPAGPCFDLTATHPLDASVLQPPPP